MTRALVASWLMTFAMLGAAACGGAEGSPGPAAPVAARRPGDAYTAYVAAIGNASAVNELYQHMSRAQRKRASGDLESIKARMPGGTLKIEAEKIEGETASVRVSATMIGKDGKEEPATGTITLVREEGGWKVDKEVWEPSK